MKKLLTAVILSALAVGAWADRISLTQARAIAANYMVEQDGPKLAKRSEAAADSTNQNLYVFSRGEGQGFVIVSGNDALPSVIGYTDSGDWDEENMPPALQNMLAYYAQAADSLNNAVQSSDTPNRVSEMRKASSGTTDIEALMTSHWHQSSPYNDQAPYITGTTTRAATGCVATAASQILYYWRKDLNDRTNYATPTYSYGDAPVTESIPSGTPLKWDIMQDSYSSSSPSEMCSAVATLVKVVGASGWLTYGSSTSGQISDQVNVFSSQFGLNGGATVWKSSYSQSTWEKMIIQDLEEGRPILYSGVNSSSGGHAVVIDGYRVSDNLFHFNFGWGSGNGYDGYYTVDDDTGMNGFNESQGMVWNVYPKTPNITGSLLLDEDGFKSRVDNTIVATITNNGTLTQTGFYLYCLTGTNTPSSSTTAQASDTDTEIASGETAKIKFTFAPSAATTYTVYLCDANKNILDKVTDVVSSASVADLTLKALSVESDGTSETQTVDGQQIDVKHVYNTKTTNVTATLYNGTDGTLCVPTVKDTLYVLTDGAWVQQSTKSKKNVTFAADDTQDVIFDLSGLTEGSTYKFKLGSTASTNRNYDIEFEADGVIYFRMMGSNLTATSSDDGMQLTLSGNYNATALSSLTAADTVCRYDLTGLTGLSGTLSAANPNALFYVSAESGMSGTNIIADGVCQSLELTPGYNFQPSEDFQAISATYHATQAVGQFGTAYLPFDAQTPSGLFARKVNQIKTTYLQDVDSCNLEMKGGTPYEILSGAAVDITAQNVAVSVETPSLGTDSLRGTWLNLVAGEKDRVMNTDETQYFDADEGATIPALTAYVPDYNYKVRATSYTYNAKDKRAKVLAQTIQEAYALLSEVEDAASKSAQQRLLAAINEAEDTLRTQPIATLQSDQITALEEAMTSCSYSASSDSLNGALDKTGLITNPSFETGSVKGWSAASASAQNITSSLANYMSGATGDYVGYVKAGGSLSQTITGVESGTYTLKADVACDEGQQVRVTVNSDSVTVDATDFGPMYFQTVALEGIQVTDGELTITLSGVDDWAKFDNIRLIQTEGVSVGVDDVLSAAPQTSTKTGIYDLSGRRLQKAPQRGLYLQDGKVVIVK